MKKFSDIWVGLAVCAAIAAVCTWLGKMAPVVGGPVFAILIGMCIALRWKERSAAQPGIQFSSKIILQLAVVLLGFGMNLSDIVEKGKQSLSVIGVTITTALVLSYILYRALKMQPKISVLIGVGSSICGGSAIAAAAPVIGASDEDIAQSISVIFLFNVAAAIIFPWLGTALGLSNQGFGLFAGSAVNDTSSVTAAATAWDGMYGSNTLDDATIVKLTRTLAIIPITLALAFIRTRKEQKAAEHGGVKISLKKIFPFFILFFLLASVVTTVFSLPHAVTAPLKEASKFLIVTAMAAIGLNTNIVKLVKSGGKPILMGFCCWCAITVTCLIMQKALNIW